MDESPLTRASRLRTASTSIAFAVILALSCRPMPAQNSGSQGFLRHLTFKGSGGITSPVGGTGGIMSEGWNAGLGAGYQLNKKIGVLLEWQFNRTGVGNNLLQYNLLPSGSYHLWTVSANPTFTYWHHGKFGGYVVGGGGFSRTLTTYNGPGNNAQCYLLCTCYNNCNTVTAQSSVRYHYSSNQPMADAGLGFTMQLSTNHRYRLFTEARYQNLFENSNYAPYKNAEVIPLSFGVLW